MQQLQKFHCILLLKASWLIEKTDTITDTWLTYFCLNLKWKPSRNHIFSFKNGKYIQKETVNFPFDFFTFTREKKHVSTTEKYLITTVKFWHHKECEVYKWSQTRWSWQLNLFLKSYLNWGYRFHRMILLFYA